MDDEEYIRETYQMAIYLSMATGASIGATFTAFAFEFLSGSAHAITIGILIISLLIAVYQYQKAKRLESPLERFGDTDAE